MAKTVLFCDNCWARTRAVSGLTAVLWLSVLLLLTARSSFALGKPTDLQAVEPSPDDVSAAARHFDEGRSAFKQERYVEAAEAFEKADALAPNAKVLLLAIQSRELGGHLSRAATLGALASQRHPNDELFADLGQLFKAARSEFNFVAVLCDDPCQIMVGNRLLHGPAATRRFLYLEQGKYRLRATWTNGKSLSKYYEAEVGRKGTVRFDSASQRSDDATAGASEYDATGQALASAADKQRTNGSGSKTSPNGEPDEDYWADGESDDSAEGDPPDDPFAAGAQRAESEDFEAPDAQASASQGWSPLVFWVGAGATVVLAGVSAWSGIHTLDNPGREAVVRECVGLGINCPTYQEGLRNQDRTNILWTVTASVGALSGLVGLLLTDWEGAPAPGGKQVAVKGERHLSWGLQPLLTVDTRERSVTRGAISVTGPYVTATGRF